MQNIAKYSLYFLGCLIVFLVVVNLSKNGPTAINPTTQMVAFEREKDVEVYFVLNKDNADSSHYCASSTPILKKVLNAETLGLGALEKLISGPSPLEKRRGYVSYIKEDARLKSFEINNAIAYIAFYGDYVNEDVDVSVNTEKCVSSAKAQIENTLTVLPDIDKVVIE